MRKAFARGRAGRLPRRSLFPSAPLFFLHSRFFPLMTRPQRRDSARPDYPQRGRSLMDEHATARPGQRFVGLRPVLALAAAMFGAGASTALAGSPKLVMSISTTGTLCDSCVANVCASPSMTACTSDADCDCIQVEN